MAPDVGNSLVRISAAFAGFPFVYGPVGGCVGTIWRLLPELGWQGASYEVVRELTRGLARYANPLARRSWRRANLILAQNAETQDWFPRRQRAKTRLFSNAVIREDHFEGLDSPVEAASRHPTALFAGRLEPWKGVFLCLHTLALLPEWRLVICGAGRDEQRMYRLAQELGVGDRVVWTGWLPQEELLSRMADADVFLFPCLREEAGAVIVEARAAQLPVVCLDRGGPPLLIGPTGISVAGHGGTGDIARRLADAALTCLERRVSGQVPDSESESLALANRAQMLQDLVVETLGLPTDTPGARRRR